MKQIMFAIITVLAFSGLLLGQEESLDEAIKYLEENGYEYEIAYDEAVKELPEGAVIFTPFGVEMTKQEAEEALSSGGGYAVLDSTTIQTDYAFGDIWYPEYYRLMIVGGYSVSPIGNLVSYKFMWERNTTANQGSPGWVGITQSSVCTQTNSRYGAIQGNLANCSCAIYNGYYECSTSSFGYYLLNYYSGTSACNQCDNSPRVFSVRFSVNPRSLTYVFIGGVWVPIYLYLGWTSVLTDGDGTPFTPVWNLCNTNLYNFCD